MYRDIKIEYPADWNLNCHVDVKIPVNSFNISPEFEADVREAVDDINTNIDCSSSVKTDVSMEIEFLVRDDPSVVGDDELFRNVNEPSVLYREKYSKELLVRKYKTEDFSYLAFPWLYPYGRGYDTKITDIKYARLVLQQGYDRRFQGADDFIFLYYYEIMNKKAHIIGK